MVTYEPADLFHLKSEVRDLRTAIKAIEKKLGEEENAKRRKEHRNMTLLTVWACTMWALWLLIVIIGIGPD